MLQLCLQVPNTLALPNLNASITRNIFLFVLRLLVNRKIISKFSLLIIEVMAFALRITSKFKNLILKLFVVPFPYNKFVAVVKI